MDRKISGTEKSQLTHIRKQEKLNGILKKIVIGDSDLSNEDKEYLLMNALLMFKLYNADNRYKSYFELAYYIVLKYSLLFKEYKPLFDISSQIGFFPICNFIVNKNLITFDNIFSEISYKIIQNKYLNERESYIETLEQRASKKYIVENKNKYIAYIAPTSYGKSSVIIDIINNDKSNKIGIIVPTKSLLIQTYNTIKKAKLAYKLILHDEMHNNEERFIGILTQERAMRLLKKGVIFDTLFIDEAHNILKYKTDDFRGVLLTRVIKLNESRNLNQKVIYLTPLIADANNLRFIGQEKILSKHIIHNLKSEEIYLFENNIIEKYNRFTDEFYNLKTFNGFYKYIIENSEDKNFIYNNRPINVEKISLELSTNLNEIDIDSSILKIIETLKKEVHENFNAIKYIRKGVVYIHGMMPNLVKEYLEHQFKISERLKYIVANSVILEGINFPIDTLFISSTNYMQGKELTNLIGRVNRLNYIFNNNIHKLIPNIHFLNQEEFQGKYSMRKKIQLLRNSGFEDNIRNPLLSEYDIEKITFSSTKEETKEQVKERRVKKDKEIYDLTEYLIKTSKVNTFEEQVKKYFIENSFDECYLQFEQIVIEISQKMLNLKYVEAFQKTNLIDKIYQIFIQDSEDYINDYEIERLKNEKARNYYLHYLTYTQKQSIKQNVIDTWKYFKTKSMQSDPYLFIGSSYGTEARLTNKYKNIEYTKAVYVNLKGKNDDVLINLAIVKLKIEENFVNYKLNKFIECLYDFNLISEDEYYLYIYGTNNHDLITYARLGINLNSVKKIHEDGQLENLTLDVNGNLTANDNFYRYLEMQDEFFKFEIHKYL